MALRLLSAAWECPAGFYGGLGTVVSRLVPALASLGHEVAHVCTEAFGRPTGVFRFGGALVYRPEGTWVSRGGYVGRCEAAVVARACLDLLQWADAVVAHDYHAALCAAAAQELGVRSAFFVHTPMDSVMEYVGATAADAVVTNSGRTLEALAAAVGGWVRGKARVAYPPPPYGPVERARKFRDEPVFLIVTRYQFNKDPGWFLEVVDGLRRRGRFRGSVILAGRGVELYGYGAKYPWLHVASDISEHRKVEALASADVLVQASLSEGYGLTPLEAIALGTPALVSSGAGVSEVVPFELIRPDDPGRTAEVVEAAQDPRFLEDLLERQRRLPIVRKTWREFAGEVLP